MNTLTEPARELRVFGECDVLVCGGGIAGISAAVAAARSGAKVTLLEREYMLGGLATLGLITIYLAICDGEGHQVSFGLAEELLRLSIKRGVVEDRYPAAWLDGGTLEEKKKKRFAVQYNANVFAVDAEKLLTDLGVNILYGTLASQVAVTDGKITHVIVENKSGRSAIAARSVVDCTGDADICKLSGEDCETFRQGNILAAWYYRFCEQEGVRLRSLGASDVPEEYKTKKTENLLTERRFTGLDGQEISEMVITSHQTAIEDFEKFRSQHPYALPVTFPTIPQIRMTRRIVGAVTLDDKEPKKFEPTSIGMVSDWRKRGPVYELPFECLYGKKIKNLITAGRNISVTDSMWDITRVIPDCAVTGQAAGTAAAMCDDFSALDVKSLQKKLVSDGVVLHWNEIDKKGE